MKGMIPLKHFRKSQEEPHLPLFVYGTLMRGFGNQRHYLPDYFVVKWEDATLPGYAISAIGGGIPHMFPYDIGVPAKGMLVYIRERIYDEVVMNIDALEGAYDKKIVNTVRADGTTQQAYAYIGTWGFHKNCIIKSGSYAEHIIECRGSLPFADK